MARRFLDEGECDEIKSAAKLAGITLSKIAHALKLGPTTLLCYLTRDIRIQEHLIPHIWEVIQQSDPNIRSKVGGDNGVA